MAGRPRNTIHRVHVQVTEKRCPKCRLVKPRAEFHADTRRRDGLQTYCRTCQAERFQAYRLANADYFAEHGRARYRRERHRNAERYAADRDGYLARKAAYGATVRGRLVTLLYSAKCRAAKAGVAYDLDIEWALGRWEHQSGRCLLTGLAFSLATIKMGAGRFDPMSPSLDRISHKRGYTRENTRLVCTGVNLALNRFGEVFFRRLCRAYLGTRKRGHK